MKKRLIRCLCMLAAVICLCACGKEQTEGTKGTTDAASTSASETTVVTDAALPLTVVANAATEYKIVRPEDASQEVIRATMALHQTINQVYGIEMGLASDFEKRGFDISTRYPYEIVVGATNREESAAAKELIRYHDSIIAVMGNRVVITGGCDEAVIRAIDYFMEKYLVGNTLTLEAELRDTVPGEYPMEGMRIGGVDIAEYTIVYATAYKEAAYLLADRIGDACGAIMTVKNDREEKTGKEIVLCSDKRGAVSRGMGSDDFTVELRGEDIFITGGSANALATGCARMLKVLCEQGDAAPDSLALSYTLPDRQDYIEDISRFALNWELAFETPAWMLDYQEKYAAMADADGRLMSCLHRGDMQRYPENSIEGLISAVMMGADMVEIDPRRTKDGVLILLHDATLTRTTDFSEKAGKNGLPTSSKVADWTYEQLMQLNLKEGAGGTNARVTPYQIPTLDEAFHVCANRLFIRLDVKADDSGKIFWDYEKDIWPLMVRYKSYTNVIYTWHAAFSSSSYALVKKYKAEQIKLCGQDAYHFRKGSGSATDILVTMQKNPDVFDPTIRLTDFDLSKVSYKSYLKSNEAKLKALYGHVRCYVDAHTTHADYPENKEGETMFTALNEAGINILLVNRGFDLCTYIAAHFEGTAY